MDRNKDISVESNSWKSRYCIWINASGFIRSQMRELTSVSSSILAPSACSRASRVSKELVPDLWSVKYQERNTTNVMIVLCLKAVRACSVFSPVRINIVMQTAEQLSRCTQQINMSTPNKCFMYKNLLLNLYTHWRNQTKKLNVQNNLLVSVQPFSRGFLLKMYEEIQT